MSTLKAQIQQLQWQNVPWRSVFSDIFLLFAGGLIFGVTVNLFYTPYDIAPSGAAGIAVILNSLIGTPVGLMVLIINIPIQIVAYRILGGWQIIAKTMFLLVVYSLAVDLLAPYFRPEGITTDRLLAAIFGGILGGIAGGLVYRAGGSFGGTSTVAVILQQKRGTSFNATYLYTDMFIIAAAGLVFGWESALYAMIAIFIDGAASDYVLDGPSTVRTGTIITNRPKEVSEAIMETMNHGVTHWAAEGMYTGKTRHVLFVSVRRPEYNTLRQIVLDVDEEAFIVIGQGHSAYGEGFLPPKRR